MSAVERMQHHDAWIDPDTHQVQQTIYLATANTDSDDPNDMFEILSNVSPEDVRDTGSAAECTLESYDATPTFDA